MEILIADNGLYLIGDNKCLCGEPLSGAAKNTGYDNGKMVLRITPRYNHVHEMSCEECGKKI